MDKIAQDHRDQLDDEFEPVELGSVSEETKGSEGPKSEGVTINSRP